MVKYNSYWAWMTEKVMLKTRWDKISLNILAKLTLVYDTFYQNLLLEVTRHKKDGSNDNT